jgi:hypothetical protein
MAEQGSKHRLVRDSKYKSKIISISFIQDTAKGIAYFFKELRRKLDIKENE